jgi:glycerol-3-phosphate dehydrogenase
MDLGASMLNHAPVTGLLRDDADHVCGVTYRDEETGTEHEAKALVVVNATGVFSNVIRRMDDAEAESVVEPSRGVHLVLDQSFLQGDTAIMVPHTDDGRVLFVIPWHERCLVGTTDEHAPEPILEPRATDEEIEFILRNAARYLEHDPERADVLSVFAGLRPLVKHEGQATKKISREHEIIVSRGGLVTIIGGKWTTYRRMAADVMDHAIDVAGLERCACATEELRLRGWMDRDDSAMPTENWLRVYGADAPEVMAACDELEDGHELLHDRLPYPRGVVLHATRHELARTVEDVLARRTRALLLDAAAAADTADAVGSIMASELGRDQAWADQQAAAFRELAAGYQMH